MRLNDQMIRQSINDIPDLIQMIRAFFIGYLHEFNLTYIYD